MKILTKTLLLLFLSFSLTRTYAQVPIHSSLPGAPATIFLDFDGQLVENTGWNWSGPLTLAPANMTPAQITEIFNRIAEDYRPFNINITTDSTKYWAAPATQRTRVILTVSSSWYGAAGGVAYMNSFIWGDNTPCFVFTALLGYNAKYVAEAASHEAGHTLGLRHQSSYDPVCNKTAEYNPGTGSGEIAWAPIMGVGYYRNFTLWNNGANPYGCTSYQDDLSIITSSDNGFGYRADDHSNNAGGSATQTTFVNNQFNLNGIIEKISDKDNFKFSMPTNGQFQLTAVPYNIGAGNVGSNLDLQVTLLSGPNTVVGVYNPQNTLSVVIDTLLASGNYFLRIEGKGNLYAPEYASLGSYSLEGNLMAFGVLPLHQLELKGRKQNGRHQLNWNIEADEKVVNQQLEVSGNGNDFKAIAFPSAEERAYSYSPAQNGTLHYRLRLQLDNGLYYYSNRIMIPSENERLRPYLNGNQVGSILKITSPAAYDFTITHINGSVVSRGHINAGQQQVALPQISRGMYIIQYYSPSETFSDKFVKQ